MNSNAWNKKRVLITVKAYPQFSKKYIETVCTAGITEDGQWIRIYPLPFRNLPKDKQFSKYQWIEIELQRNENDNREQSYRPKLSSITIVSPVLSTKNSWSARNDVVLKTVAPSLEYLKENYPKTSLGIIRPKQILGFVAEKSPKNEMEEYQQLVMNFGDDGAVEITSPLRPIPYKFSYMFLCDDVNCKKPHKLSIIDWELGSLIYNLQKSGRADEEIKKMVENKYFEFMCSPTKDTHFIVGNKYPYPDTFMVLGVYYPDAVRQLSLFQ
jgi:hypothetical protein